MVASLLMTSGVIWLSAVCLAASAPSARTAAVAGFNPDSSGIAFASHRDGNWEIYVMDAAGQSRRLTTRDAQDRFPVWSPDGAQIAFGSEVGTGWELWIMDSDGRRQRRLYSGIVAKS